MKKKWILLILVLVLVALIILSIPVIWRNLPDGGLACKTEYMSSNKEFREFIAKYNSKNDGFASSFISVDWDDMDFISERIYTFEMVVRVEDKEFYDSNTMFEDTKIYFYFTYDNSEYKIKCEYSKKDIHFSVDDKFEIKKLDPNDEESAIAYRLNINDYYREDRIDEDDPFPKYTYGYQYVLMINGNEEMSIKILSEKEIDEENLNDICQLLLNNIVILE